MTGTREWNARGRSEAEQDDGKGREQLGNDAQIVTIRPAIGKLNQAFGL